MSLVPVAPETRTSEKFSFPATGYCVPSASLTYTSKLPSFGKELYLGRLRLDLISPFPEEPAEVRAEGDAFMRRIALVIHRQWMAMFWDVPAPERYHFAAERLMFASLNGLALEPSISSAGALRLQQSKDEVVASVLVEVPLAALAAMLASGYRPATGEPGRGSPRIVPISRDPIDTNSATFVQKLWNYCNVLRDGDALFDHYRHTLEELGKQPGKIEEGLKKIAAVAQKDPDFSGVQWNTANHAGVCDCEPAVAFPRNRFD